VQYRITRHSGHFAPADAMELLRRVGAQRDEISFAMVGAEIRATLHDRTGDSATRAIRAEIGRRAILDIVVDACERAPELKADWFAVSHAS
jgi:hypothetical protein